MMVSMKYLLALLAILLLVVRTPAVFAQSSGGSGSSNGQIGQNGNDDDDDGNNDDGENGNDDGENGNDDGENGDGMFSKGSFGDGQFGNGTDAAIGSGDSLFYVRKGPETAGVARKIDIVAIRAGSPAWTSPVADGRIRLTVSGDLVLVSSTKKDAGSPRSHVVALAAATGATKWSADVDGTVRDVEPFDGGIYLTVAKGSHTGTVHTLVALDGAGKTLWTLPID
jgi:outer membrane protein assembly factor BamB